MKPTFSYWVVIKFQIKHRIAIELSERGGEEVETSDRSCEDGRHRVEPGSHAGDVMWKDERVHCTRLSVYKAIRLLSCEPHLTNRGT